ncbi:zinc ABC transporter substrate-binding protein ZnuA [Martelella alba]|uniref:High-affinity zinc uptake system protein ZnuA n=1 Tax=Martelella alba TaxID=2590451 RepID=A0ABY2SQ95_9HYPH|nr:zinc ABC transporter substrate-binding protein ZnuA [Martelella alba]TKI08238.1 zinc ABC transporter substrate-binding protein ZnuA [Martelella alba]
MNSPQTKWLGALITAVLLLIGAAGQSRAAMLVSIRPLGFIASAIGDGVIDTDILLPDGASPHGYALRPSDLGRIRRADLVIWIGPEMEAFLTKPVRELPAQSVLTLSDLPSVRPLLQLGHDDDDTRSAHGDHDHGRVNMHLWLSPAIAEAAAIAIHDRLLALKPDKKSQLDENLQSFTASLTKNDKTIATMLAPVAGKGYFVFHDAYGYFEKHYGLSPLGHFTLNPEIQPGAQALHTIRTQLVEHKAVCIFAEPQFRPAVIDAVARGTSVRKGTLDPLGIGIPLGKESYFRFLTQLSDAYLSCLNTHP